LLQMKCLNSTAQIGKENSLPDYMVSFSLSSKLSLLALNVIPYHNVLLSALDQQSAAVDVSRHWILLQEVSITSIKLFCSTRLVSCAYISFYHPKGIILGMCMDASWRVVESKLIDLKVNNFAVWISIVCFQYSSEKKTPTGFYPNWGYPEDKVSASRWFWSSMKHSSELTCFVLLVVCSAWTARLRLVKRILCPTIWWGLEIFQFLERVQEHPNSVHLTT
jgi:hypothetical protein